MMFNCFLLVLLEEKKLIYWVLVFVNLDYMTKFNISKILLFL